MDWSTIFTLTFLIQVLAASVRLATPLVLTALGEIFAERSGVLNLGVEGIMLFSGFTGFSIAILTKNNWLGVGAGILAGALMGFLFGVWTVSLRTNQIVTGLALLILSNGAAIYFYRIQFGSYKIFPQVEPFRQLTIPVLSQLPILGPILFNQNILTLTMVLLVPLCLVVLNYTRVGLRINAVGEQPAAADTVGISVKKICYLCVILGGALAGLSGAYFPLAELGFYSNSMVNGRGFIALALVVFGGWNPFFAFIGGLLFGLIDAIQIRIQLVGTAIPAQFLIMMPDVLTVLVILIGRTRQAPSALTTPYSRE